MMPDTCMDDKCAGTALAHRQLSVSISVDLPATRTLVEGRCLPIFETCTFLRWGVANRVPDTLV